LGRLPEAKAWLKSVSQKQIIPFFHGSVGRIHIEMENDLEHFSDRQINELLGQRQFGRSFNRMDCPKLSFH
jgi:hypothetical protein